MHFNVCMRMCLLTAYANALVLLRVALHVQCVRCVRYRDILELLQGFVRYIVSTLDLTSSPARVLYWNICNMGLHVQLASVKGKDSNKEHGRE